MLAALRLLPDRAAAALGSGLGWLAWSGLKIRRGLVLESLARAFPEKSLPELERSGEKCYRNLGRTFLEAFRMTGRVGARLMERVELEGREVLDRALEQGKGVVNVTFHYGNWELMGACAARRGYPLEVIARRQRNPWFDRFITRERAASGMGLIPVEEAPRKVLRALRAGRIVTHLADQDAGRTGVFVEFLGRPASTPKGPALYAWKSGAPLVLTMMLPAGRGPLEDHFRGAGAPGYRGPRGVCPRADPTLHRPPRAPGAPSPGVVVLAASKVEDAGAGFL